MKKKKYKVILISILMWNLSAYSARVGANTKIENVENIKLENINPKGEQVNSKIVKDKLVQKDKIEEKREFREKDYETKEYELKVYYLVDIDNENFKKIPILVYKHINTGAIVACSLVEDEKILEKTNDSWTCFNRILNSLGINHIFEHCMGGEDSVQSDDAGSMSLRQETNASTTNYGVTNIVSSFPARKDDQFLKREFIDPFEGSFMHSKNLKDFLNLELYGKLKLYGEEFEVGRIYIEMEGKQEEERFYKEQKFIDYKEDDKFKIIVGGDPKELKKITAEKVVKAYDMIVHPSNSFTWLNMPYSPKQVKETLAKLNKLFSRYKKREYDHAEERAAQKDIMLKRLGVLENQKVKCFKDDPMFRYRNFKKKDEEKYDSTKFKGELIIPLETEDELLKNKYVPRYIRFDAVQKNLPDEVKKLGYKHVRIITNVDELSFEFFGDDEKVFQKDIIVKNSQILLNKLIEKIKKAPKSQYKDFFTSHDEELLKESSQMMNRDRTLSMIASCFAVFTKCMSLYDKPVDERGLLLEGNNILFGRKYSQKYVESNIKGLDLLAKAFEPKTAKFLMLYEQTDKKSNISKDREISFKRGKNFSSKVYFDNFEFEDVYKERFIRAVFEKMFSDYLYGKGLTYYSLRFVRIHDKPAILHRNGGEKNKATMKRFFESGTFDKLLEARQIVFKKEDFDKFVKCYLESLRKSPETLNEIKTRYKDVIKKLDEGEQNFTLEELDKIEICLSSMSSFSHKDVYHISAEKQRRERKIHNAREDKLDKYWPIVSKDNKNEKERKKYLKKLSKLYIEKYKMLKEKLENIDKFNKECIKALTDEKGNIKPYDYNEIMDKIYKIRFRRFKDLNFEKWKKRQKQKRKKRYMQKQKDRLKRKNLN